MSYGIVAQQSLVMLSVVASTPYDLGYQVGVSRASSIAEFMSINRDLPDTLYPWYYDHIDEYNTFLTKNQMFYPDAIDELQGLADGAKVQFTDLMLLALEPEIETLIDQGQDQASAGHCSDILANDMYNMKLVAHNEDGGPDYVSGLFVLSATQLWCDDVKCSRHFTALTYTAHIPGFATGWTDSIAFSCNALPPNDVVVGGRARYFINRDMLNSVDMNDLVNRATPDSIALGFSTNLISLDGSRVVNIETHSTKVDIHDVEVGGYYEHTNHYLRLDVPQSPGNSTIHRYQRMLEIGEPMSYDQVLAILGDTQDSQWPIYRTATPPDTSITLATFIYNVIKGTVTIYHGSNPSSSEAIQVLSYL
ncbi:peptidase C45, acyl-coenzyme A/6-aminopenicillanic acid acyl-transferase [Pelomyxa schiedti]|nr:peptidase C45, acyl-coenzyme A/6-aminopenicillanic acid acyl-transferase [Pelomyxa schiedti]